MSTNILLGGGFRIFLLVATSGGAHHRLATGSLEDTQWMTLKPLVDELPPTNLPTVRLFGHILLAEDFDDTLMLLKHAFQRAGATVTTAVNGTEAVQAASRESFDLIVLDIQMPVMDGMRAASEIRSQGCLTPIVALTASVDPGARDRVLDAGFDDVWYKPMSIDKIIVKVADYLQTESDDGHRHAMAPKPPRTRSGDPPRQRQRRSRRSQRMRESLVFTPTSRISPAKRDWRRYAGRGARECPSPARSPPITSSSIGRIALATLAAAGCR